jgi:hypothetical protein
MTDVGDGANLLEAIFAWRPRERVRPEENFLTEALVYVLRTSPAARDAWLRLVLDDRRAVTHAAFSTRASYPGDDGGPTVFPDVEVSGAFEDGAPFLLLVEHKWGSGYDQDQLGKYARLVARAGGGSLAFVCARGGDRYAASAFAPPQGVAHRALTWAEIYKALSSVAEQTRAHMELLEFMDRQGLAPGHALTPGRIEAFVHGAGLIEQLNTFANKLLREFDWSFVPAAYRAAPGMTDRWGRVALEFATPNWAPAVTMGFLYDRSDHKVPFTSAGSIDLMLRIEASPRRSPNRQAASPELATKAALLRAAGATPRLAGDADNRNAHTLLIVQRSLVDVIAGLGTEQEQLTAVHAELRRWSELLFADGELEVALARLDSDRVLA